MANALLVDEWLRVVQEEHIRRFLKDGGASVKFAVSVDCAEPKDVIRKLGAVAEAEGYFFATVDAAQTRAHMIDQWFHAIAREVPWDDLAYAFLSTRLSEGGYRVPGRPEFNLARLAEANGVALADMRVSVNNRLRSGIHEDYAMTQEFRTAMLCLCRGLLDPEDLPPGTGDAVKQWLRGELRLVSALKPAGIFQRVGRHNARHLLFSLAHWLHASGRAGLVVVADIAHYLAVRPKEPDGRTYYSGPALLDGYEVLRQFIDGMDDVEHFLLIVLAPVAFLSDDRRGLKVYNALNMRVSDEVLDRQRPNPLATLVRLSDRSIPATVGGPA